MKNDKIKKKKDIPLQILKKLEPYVDKNGESYVFVKSDKFLLHFKDKDIESNFFFIVESFDRGTNNNGFNLLIQFKPKGSAFVELERLSIDWNRLDEYFSRWVADIEEYDKVKSVFDDPIIKSYEEYYYSEFEIIDDDADKVPFSPKILLLIDNKLEDISINIDKYKTEDNEGEIAEIKEDINELRKNLSKNNKKWVVKHLSSIWAKITKVGLPLIKEFAFKVKETSLEKGADFLFEKLTDLIF